MRQNNNINKGIDGKIAIVLWKTFDEILIVSGVKQFKNV